MLQQPHAHPRRRQAHGYQGLVSKRSEGQAAQARHGRTQFDGLAVGVTVDRCHPLDLERTFGRDLPEDALALQLQAVGGVRYRGASATGARQ